MVEWSSSWRTFVPFTTITRRRNWAGDRKTAQVSKLSGGSRALSGQGVNFKRTRAYCSSNSLYFLTLLEAVSQHLFAKSMWWVWILRTTSTRAVCTCQSPHRYLGWCSFVRWPELRKFLTLCARRLSPRQSPTSGRCASLPYLSYVHGVCAALLLRHPA